MSISANLRATRAAALYALVGGIWIIVTDQVLFQLLAYDSRITAWQTSKGWLFVAASALFVFFLARREARREESARQREAELLVITDSLPGPVSRVDRDGRYLFANFAYYEWFDRTPSEVVGRTQRDVLGEDFYQGMVPHYQRALGGERVQVLKYVPGAGGKYFWGLVTLIPDRAPDGTVQGHFTIVQDVTEAEEQRRAHAESEARYRRLVEKAPDGILVYKDGRLQLANLAAQRLVGAASESEITGRPWDMFVEERDRERAVARVEQLLAGEGGTEVTQLTLRRLDGSRVPVEVAGVRFKDAGTPALHLILRDISARTSAENALRELNKNLELRIARRTEELELARERAESADRLKSLFLASLSRQLRTPLDSVVRLSGELLRGQPGDLTEEQRKRLTVVQRAARHQQALIADVLDISGIEAGELVLDHAAYDLAAVLRESVRLPRSRARGKGLEFELKIQDGLERATGDARRVRQVLVKLLDNAVKYTDAGRISVRASMLSGDQARITVTDTGVGIPEVDQPRVFHPFSQPWQAVDRDGGTGLGLPISRGLARLLGGELTVASKPGRGSTFTLEIPLHATA